MTINNDENKLDNNKVDENKQVQEGNKFITFLAVISILVFPFILFCAWVFPEYLPFFGLNVKMCYMIVLQLISFFFILAVIQKPSLDLKWQIICIIFAFILLGESYFLLFS